MGKADTKGHDDVTVPGGGSTGSALATLHARRGRRCLVLERSQFPRYQGGESLIPNTCSTLERLGLLKKLRGPRFPLTTAMSSIVSLLHRLALHLHRSIPTRIALGHLPALLLALFLVPNREVSAVDGSDTIDVLLLSGMNNHDWRKTTPALVQSLEEAGRFKVTVLENTATMTAAMLERFDVVLSNFNTFVRRGAPERDPRWSAGTRKALIDFVRDGKGHVAVHAGSSSFYDWPEYQRMVLGSFKVGQTSHGRRHEFEVSLKSGDHAVTRGLSGFRTFDELWHDTEFQEGAEVLATAYSSRESGGSGKVEPVAVAGRYGKGRSFFLVLGHDTRGMRSTGFRALLSRGVEWAATGKVTIPPRSVAERAAIDRSPSFAWQRKRSSLALTHGGKVVWRFRHDPRLGKAHFEALAPLGGPSITRVMPPDHVWHYGLWFSWKFINGVNYWEEDPRTHRAAGLTTTTRVDCTPRADHSARIEMEIAYHLPGKTAAKFVLSEARRIEVSGARDGSYDIDWRSTFTAGPDDVELNRTPLPHEKGGKPYGGYAGLSLRMRHMADRRAVSTEGPVRFNTRDRFRGKARAFDYSGDLDGRTVGVAILDHPENLHAPTPWYAIRSRSMTFFSPAVICFRPHTLKAGASFELRYRVVVHGGRWDETRLRSEYERYVGRKVK